MTYNFDASAAQRNARRIDLSCVLWPYARAFSLLIESEARL
jgi:hypothetical protein